MTLPILRLTEVKLAVANFSVHARQISIEFQRSSHSLTPSMTRLVWIRTRPSTDGSTARSGARGQRLGHSSFSALATARLSEANVVTTTISTTATPSQSPYICAGSSATAHSAQAASRSKAIRHESPYSRRTNPENKGPLNWDPVPLSARRPSSAKSFESSAPARRATTSSRMPKRPTNNLSTPFCPNTMAAPGDR